MVFRENVPENEVLTDNWRDHIRLMPSEFIKPHEIKMEEAFAFSWERHPDFRNNLRKVSARLGGPINVFFRKNGGIATRKGEIGINPYEPSGHVTENGDIHEIKLWETIEHEVAHLADDLVWESNRIAPLEKLLHEIRVEECLKGIKVIYEMPAEEKWQEAIRQWGERNVSLMEPTAVRAVDKSLAIENESPRRVYENFFQLPSIYPLPDIITSDLYALDFYTPDSLALLLTKIAEAKIAEPVEPLPDNERRAILTEIATNLKAAIAEKLPPNRVPEAHDDGSPAIPEPLFNLPPSPRQR